MRKDCDRKAPLFAEPTGVASGEYRETVEPSTAPRSVSAGTAAHHPIGESDGSRCLLRCDGGLTARCRALSPHRRSRSARGEDCSQPLPAGIGGSGRHAFGCFLGPHARGSRVPVWRRELPRLRRVAGSSTRPDADDRCGAGFHACCGSMDDRPTLLSLDVPVGEGRVGLLDVRAAPGDPGEPAGARTPAAARTRALGPEASLLPRSPAVGCRADHRRIQMQVSRIERAALAKLSEFASVAA